MLNRTAAKLLRKAARIQQKKTILENQSRALHQPLQDALTGELTADTATITKMLTATGNGDQTYQGNILRIDITTDSETGIRRNELTAPTLHNWYVAWEGASRTRKEAEISLQNATRALLGRAIG